MGRWSSPDPLHRFGAAILSAALLVLVQPVTLAGQYRRAAPILVPGDLEPGKLAAGLGFGHRRDVRFPLSGLEGNLFDVGQLEVAYGIGDEAVLQVGCDLGRVLRIRRRGPSHVDLDDDVSDGLVADFGDFRIGTVLRIAGGEDGLSTGLGFSVELPNSDERKGIGLNTTNFTGQGYLSYRRGGLRATAGAGVAILEAPLENFVQNDVLSLKANVSYGAPGATWRVYGGLSSRVNTRDRVPVGTEDRGEVEAGINLSLGGWILDLGAAGRLHGPSGRWGVDAGVARVLPI